MNRPLIEIGAIESLPHPSLRRSRYSTLSRVSFSVEVFLGFLSVEPCIVEVMVDLLVRTSRRVLRDKIKK